MSQGKHIKEFVDRKVIFVDCAPTITQKSLSSSICHECVIEGYSKLKDKVHYSMTREVKFLKRTLKLYKNKIEHRFQFHCELTNLDIQKLSGYHLASKMAFHIAYKQDEVVCPGDLTETSYGFSIEVPNEIIMDSNNTYLHERDKLVVQFRYRYFFYSKDPICRSGVLTKVDELRLSEDLVYLYENETFSDFAIIDEEEEKHFVHKAICSLRSKAIQNIDDENVVAMTIDGKFRHVEIAIRYMYGGILPQLSVDDLLKLTEVAEGLEIPRLIVSINLALLEILNESNAAEIHKAILKFPNMQQIAAQAEELLQETTEERTR